MKNDIQLQHQDMLEESRQEHPEVIFQQQSRGERGRPKIHIDYEFLAWAITQRSVASIARFLGLHRNTVTRCLVEYGLTTSSEDSTQDPPSSPASTEFAQSPIELQGLQNDDVLEPHLAGLPVNTASSTVNPLLSTTLNNAELEELLLIFRSHYPRAGLRMLDGMLRALGYTIPRNRIREALIQIDPVRRVFERILIRRREYSVPGPNALWHHDGQHGN